MNQTIDDPLVDAARVTLARRVAAVKKAAADVLADKVRSLEQDHERRRPTVTVNPVVEVRAEPSVVNLAGTDMEPVAKALRELGEIVATQPVPMVQAPAPTVVQPAVVSVDMSVLEELVAMLRADAVEQRRTVASLTAAFESLVRAMEGLQETNRALILAVSRERPKRRVVVQTLENGDTVLEELA